MCRSQKGELTNSTNRSLELKGLSGRTLGGAAFSVPVHHGLLGTLQIGHKFALKIEWLLVFICNFLYFFDPAEMFGYFWEDFLFFLFYPN